MKLSSRRCAYCGRRLYAPARDGTPAVCHVHRDLVKVDPHYRPEIRQRA